MGVFDIIEGGKNSLRAPVTSTPAGPDAGFWDQAGKGLRSGLTGMGAGVQALAGTGAEALGFDEFAQARYADALRGQQQARLEAPRITSYKDAGGSLRDAASYVGGVLGGSAPSLAAGVGAGVLSGGSLPAALALGTAAQTLPEAGDVAMKQLNSPEAMATPASERFARQLGGGALSAGLQTVVPGAIGAKLVGRGAAETAKRSVKSIVGRNLAAIPGEGITEAGGQLTKQLAAGTGVDTDELGEAFVGGMVGGAPLSGLGMAGDLMHATPRKAGTAVVDAAKAAPGAVADAAGDVWDSVKGGAAAMHEAMPERVKTVLSSVSEDVGEQVAAARAKLKELSESDDLPGDIKELVKAAGKGLGVAANRAYIFTVDQARAKAIRAKEIMQGDEFQSRVDSLRQGVDDTAERIKKGLPLGDMAEFASATGERAAELMRQSTAKAAEWAQKTGTALADRADLSPKHREAVAQALQNVGDRANQVKIASIDAWAATKRKIGKFADAVSKTYKQEGDAKKSEDYEGFDVVIRDRVVPLLQEKHPELLNDPDALSQLAVGIRKFMLAAAQGNNLRVKALHGQLTELLGEDTTHSVLDALHQHATEGDPKKAEEFWRNVNEGQKVTKTRNELVDVVRKAMSAEAPGRTGVGDSAGQWADFLIAWAEGQHDTDVKGQNTARDAQVVALVEQHFGTKAKRILRAVEQHVEREQRESGATKAQRDSDEKVDDDLEYGDTEEKDVGASYYGQDSNGEGSPKLYESSDSHKASNPDYAYEPPVEQQLKKLRDRHPDKKVHFVKAKDFAKARGLTDEQTLEMTGGKDPSTHGFIKLEGLQADDGLQPWQIRVMRGQIKDKSHPDAITVPGSTIVYDARRIAKAIADGKKGEDEIVEKSKGLTFKQTLATNFAEGIAKLTQHLGQNPELRDDLVIAQIDGENFTWAEAKKELGKISTVKEPASWAGASKTEQKLLEMVPELEDQPLRTLGLRAKQTVRDTERLIAEMHAAGVPAAGVAKAEAKLATAKRMDSTVRFEQEKRSGDTRRDQLLDSEGTMRTEGDPEGQIHYAQATVGDDKLARNNPALGAKSPSSTNLKTLVNAKLDRTKSPMVPKLRGRFAKLADAMGAMTGNEQRIMEEVASQIVAGKLSDAMQAMKPLAQKYQDGIVPPSQPATEPSVSRRRDITSREIGTITEPRPPLAGDPLKRLAPEVEDLWTKVFGDDDRTGGQPTRTAGGPTSPKAVAAKKAAFLERAASGDKALIEELAASTDAKGLQRALEALLGAKRTDGTQKALDAIQARLEALVQDPDVAYGLQTKKYSLDATAASNPKALTAKGRAQILDAIHRMLGDTVQVAFGSMAHAGEFSSTEAADIIRVSVTALNPTGVAYHEALHAFFKQLRAKGGKDVTQVLERLANTPHVMKQLRDLLAHSPEATAQLKDPEEAAAYLFQFYSLGHDFKLADAPKSLFAKIKEGILKLLGVWTNDQRALHIMGYFSSGDYAKSMGDHAAVRQALMEQGRSKVLDMIKGAGGSFMDMAESLLGAGSANLRDTGIPSLARLADLVKKRVIDEGDDAGWLPTARERRSEFLNRYADMIQDADETTLRTALEALQNGENATTPQAEVLRAQVRGLLDEMWHYLKGAGVKVNDLGVGKDYFPRQWDAHHLSKNRDKFLDMARKYPEWKNPQDTFNKLIANDGSEIQVLVDRPGMSAKQERVLDFIDAKDAAPFMVKDLHRIMNSYITQATRRAEWSRRFDDDNAKLGDLLVKAKKEGATDRQIQQAKDFVRGVNGTLGDDINPHAKRVMGNMIVYQNLRLLPLAVFSMAVDPMGVAVNGGGLRQAFSTFMRGIKEIPKGLRGDMSEDAQTRFARDIGTIDNAMLQHAIGSMYTQGVTGDFARKINDTFFRFNLVEQMNTSMRVGATEAARLWLIEQHKHPGQHTQRRLAELGLTRADLQLDAQGDIVINDKIKMAINQWVDGAVLRPDAADKPVWMNDPHWMLFAHLKQFIYAFHHTILARVVHEAKHGNYTPAMALSSYVPIMIASDALKGLIQGGGDVPEWKRNWDAGDYVGNAVQRAGLLGVGQFGLDAATGRLGTLTGPSIEQLGDAAAVVGGYKQFSPFALHSLPANALYAGSLGGGAPDPVFSD